MQGDILRRREQWQNSDSFNQSSGTSETVNAFTVTSPKKEQLEVIITFIILWNMLHLPFFNPFKT